MTASDSPLADPIEENVLDEFVDLLNAQDLETIGEMLAPDVSSGFFDETGHQGVLEGLNSLHLRYPGLVFTRGELDQEPIVVAWTLGEDGAYHQMGYFTFTFTDAEGEAEPLIDHIDYDDDPSDQSELLAEEPDVDDAAEGSNWREWEYGES